MFAFVVLAVCVVAFPSKLELTTPGCGVQALHETEHGCIDFCMFSKNSQCRYSYLMCIFKRTANRSISNGSRRYLVSR